MNIINIWRTNAIYAIIMKSYVYRSNSALRDYMRMRLNAGNSSSTSAGKKVELEYQIPPISDKIKNELYLEVCFLLKQEDFSIWNKAIVLLSISYTHSD